VKWQYAPPVVVVVVVVVGGGVYWPFPNLLNVVDDMPEPAAKARRDCLGFASNCFLNSSTEPAERRGGRPTLDIAGGGAASRATAFFVDEYGHQKNLLAL